MAATVSARLAATGGSADNRRAAASRTAREICAAAGTSGHAPAGASACNADERGATEPAGSVAARDERGARVAASAPRDSIGATDDSTGDVTRNDPAHLASGRHAWAAADDATAGAARDAKTTTRRSDDDRVGGTSSAASRSANSGAGRVRVSSQSSARALACGVSCGANDRARASG